MVMTGALGVGAMTGCCRPRRRACSHAASQARKVAGVLPCFRLFGRGFHWNRERQAWQHPCGQFRLSSNNDPHEKYSSYRPASIRRSAKKQPTETAAA
jgi:hypothetical protein